MRLNPNELLRKDDSSIGALVREGLLQEGIDLSEEMNRLSDEELSELLGKKELSDDIHGMSYWQCPFCSELVMFAKGANLPIKCPECGKEITNDRKIHSSDSPVHQTIININGKDVDDSSKPKDNKNDEHLREDEVLQFGETLSIKDVPIFMTGTHNGVPYSTKDLDLMVKNFGILKEKVIPPLKLGHKGQKILKSQGLPAAGWMNDLKRKGEYLLASFKQVPKRVARLIKDGAWKRPSAEIYKNYKDGQGKEYGYVIAATALLGSDTPAIKELPAWDSLPEIETLYNSSLDDLGDDDLIVVELQFNDVDLVSADDERSKKSMNEEQDTKMEKRLADIEAAMKKQKEDHEAEMEAMAKKVESAQIAAHESSIEAFLEKAKKEGKLTPAVEEKVKTFASHVQNAEPIKFTEEGEDGKEVDKEMTVFELFKDIINSLPTIVDYSERSTGDDGETAVVVKVGTEKFEAKKTEEITEADVHEKILKLCEEKGWDPEDATLYGDAYILLSEEDPN